MFKKKKYLFYLLPLILTGCAAPLIIGAGGAGAAYGTKEKGIRKCLTDSEIQRKIKLKLYAYDTGLYSKISVIVENSEVFLMGVVDNEEWKTEPERLAREVKDVSNIVNDIEVLPKGTESIGSVASDKWITTQVNSAIFFLKYVRSMNYTVKTVKGITYVMGIAQNEEELNKVLEAVRRVGGVQKVVCHVRIREQKDVQDSVNENGNPISGDNNEVVVHEE